MKKHCPDCRRGFDSDIIDGKIKCRKCYQYIVLKDSEPVKCVPKELVE